MEQLWLCIYAKSTQVQCNTKDKDKNEFHKGGTLTQAPRKFAPVTDVQQAVYGPYVCCTIPVQKLRQKPTVEHKKTPAIFERLGQLTLQQQLQTTEVIWIVTDGGVNNRVTNTVKRTRASTR
eukprot:6867453-Ditylum_brightwellii.AAC.1